MQREVNWGIIGPGRIAQRLASEWSAIKGGRIAAVASREGERARAFATAHAIEQSYDSYDALLADPVIDIVYIALPHNFHLDVCLRALAAGKAVFCEKPMGLNARETKEMIDAARSKGLLLMEAVKTRFMPAIRKAQEWTKEGRIGKPALLQAFFQFDVGDDLSGRHLNPDLAGGAMLDLGVYPLTLAEMLLGADPVQILATATLASTGVDATTAMTLRYEEGALAQLSVSVAMAAGTHARLWGERGYIDLPQFNQGRVASLRVGEFSETYTQEGEGSFCFEIEEAHRCLRLGLTESPIMTWEASLRMAQWHDEILEQVHR